MHGRCEEHTNLVILGKDLSIQALLQSVDLVLKLLLGCSKLLYLTALVLHFHLRSTLLDKLLHQYSVSMQRPS